ncbi:hypothetical protein JOB18_004871 [Solea senegalensis]|uniref:BCL2 binding component 3 n=1 Tax=Solea senegalensis TaxID=28829 RepID=A0AAV6PYG5_SOLSE|nr:uncharacterized protein LOC122773889 [Solea senegalensis]KAG7478652.1 hypothetical protein JOB18_004871 [Solea senegalensis]
MARAETIESAGETGGGGGNGPLPRHICHMELPRSPHTWSGLLTTTTTSTDSGAIHLRHHHPLHPLQPLHLLYALPDEPQTHQQFPALLPPLASPPVLLCNQSEDRDGRAVQPSAFSGEESDSDIEEHQEASSQPLPDLLPQNEHLSWVSPHHRAPRREAVQELDVRRVATQLRTIGDQFNATVLHRPHVAPYWQDWRDACRGLLNLITQTLSTLYRLT